MTIPKLSERLRRAADLVRQDSFVADVGTDHAYLPIALLAEGKIRGGVVSDINKGPIERAQKNICACGFEDRLTPILCDGLSQIQPFSPEDILILGMGGELIASILAAAPWTKDKNIQLILQPMTHPEVLRRFLLEEGYQITEEVLVKEEKIYQILSATYGDEEDPYTALELLVGRKNLLRRDTLTEELLLHWERVLTARRDGKRSAGAASPEEDELLREIGEWKK